MSETMMMMMMRIRMRLKLRIRAETRNRTRMMIPSWPPIGFASFCPSFVFQLEVRKRIESACCGLKFYESPQHMEHRLYLFPNLVELFKLWLFVSFIYI